MKVLWIATVIAVGAVTCCFAQEPPASKAPIMLESKESPIGLDERRLASRSRRQRQSAVIGLCNQRLKFQVDAIQPSVNSPPLDARSQDVRIGIVNAAAAAQQLAKRAPPVRIPVPGGHWAIRHRRVILTSYFQPSARQRSLEGEIFL